MITQVQIRGESESAERLHGEFEWLSRCLEEAFGREGVQLSPGHVLVERCSGDPDVSVFGNWKGRCTLHMDTQRLNEQLSVEVPGAAA